LIAALLALAVVTATSAPISLPPRVVLAQYAEALATIKEPPAMTFDYTIAQSGANAIYETHRVYRSGDKVRDETIAQDGHNLTVPVMRVSTAKPFRYSLSRVAPRPEAYALTFARADLTGRHYSYTFLAVPRVPGDFTVTSVTIDGLSFLPSALTFTTTAGGVKARGMLVYAKTDSYWMIADAIVEAKLEAGIASERLSFRNFQFPASLPAETFRS
jgi:hypothetical protein